MAKAAKKSAAKPAAKTAAKAKPEKKAAPKKTAPKKEAKKEEPKEEKSEESAPVAPKVSKKEKLAKIASDKALSEDLRKWIDLQDKFGSEKAASYNMTATYQANKPIQHKVLGWGYILSVQNDRLEVLFETGTKMLISNYKPR